MSGVKRKRKCERGVVVLPVWCEKFYGSAGAGVYEALGFGFRQHAHNLNRRSQSISLMRGERVVKGRWCLSAFRGATGNRYDELD